ncbi:MAG: NmrA family NAD(P)-binding protein [Desulfovibrionaceae bacterium]
MRILVTGATGALGGAVLAELASRGVSAVAAVRDPESESARALGVPLVRFDFADPESLPAALDGADRLFLMLPLHQEMRKWGAAAIAAARQAGVGLVVRSSCMGADPNAHFQLGKLHGALDADLQDSGLPFVTLRPAAFMQNYSGLLAPLIRQYGAVPVPEAGSRTSFVDLRDAASAAAGVLADGAPQENSFYVVTGPEALDNHQVAGAISAACGREFGYAPLEVEEYGLALEASGVPEWNVHMLLSMHRYARSDYTSFKTSAVEHLSGRPARSFAQFAAEHASAWK